MTTREERPVVRGVLLDFGLAAASFGALLGLGVLGCLAGVDGLGQLAAWAVI